MKFRKITYFSETENIIDEEEFKYSIYGDLLDKFETDWNNISFTFNEGEDSADSELLLELYYFLEAQGELIEKINDEVSFYMFDETPYALIDKGDVGLAVKRKDIEYFENIM